jgi:hypothetical protein
MAYTTIDDPELYFQVKTYTGNSDHYITGDSQAITFDGSEDMSPNLVWLKSRTQGGTGYNGNHCLFDSVRGTTKYMEADSTATEKTQSGVTAFGSDGFTVGPYDIMNNSGDAFVAWCWKAGTSFTNDASATSIGDTDSSGSASSTAGFSICSYHGAAGGSSIEVKHGLGTVPHVMITKCLTDANSWAVYHHKNTAAPETDYLDLDTDDATADHIAWDDTAPTSAIFTAGDYSSTNRDDDFISYFWTGIQGFSKFGSYTGNGNADGIFVYTGFRPAFYMSKRTDSTDDWNLHDNKRPAYNPANKFLEPNTSDAEETRTIDFLSNGIKHYTSNAGYNADGGTYIYMAFAEAPFVNSNGVPCNAR